jgi:hypothetical protein
LGNSQSLVCWSMVSYSRLAIGIWDRAPMVQSEVPFLLEVPHFRLQLSWFELGNCIPIHCPGIDLRQPGE